MRNAFADEITKIGATDPRVVLLSGDIGNRLFDKFKQNNEGRFFNCGVAEANMTGVAAGLARQIIQSLVAGDRRFLCTPEGLVSLTPSPQIRSRPIRQHRYSVLDLETTGGSPVGGACPC